MNITGPSILEGNLLPYMAKGLVERGSGEASKVAPPRFKEACFTCRFGPVLCEVCSLLELTRGLYVSLSSWPQSCRD